MSEDIKFDFADDSIAQAYDDVLVPLLFDPWTTKLIHENEPWSSRYVLDLACGTGAVTKQLLNQVTCTGKVFALDLNEEMLAINKAKFEELGCDDVIEFIHASAEAIPIENNTLDIVVCQQGFQFFPDKLKAAEEIYRVLNKDGKLIISTWLPVSECEIFGTLCETLETIEEEELSQLIRLPFDYMPKEELKQIFTKAGFNIIEIEKQKMDLYLQGGVEEAIAFIHSTPIGLKIKGLPKEKQEALKRIFKENVKIINGTNFGKMVTYVLKARK
ncbi:class I SAM-dependent methyltransferase [uncultured Aquimarina sp.]|uniref:class I SAM-dependent methyltransferase n=1 Tax=uncultured Aquimarina sp. TaxID=575652 RepID=UPI00261BE78B|nr:class I SAM-dependent methyltransferase [uncultured Aquimarina sp.]